MKKPSAKQIAWRKKFAQMVKAGAFKGARGKRKTAKKRASNPAPAMPLTPARKAAPRKNVRRAANPAPKKRVQTPRGGCNPTYAVRVQRGGKWHVVSRVTSQTAAEKLARLLASLGIKHPIQVWA